MNTLNMYLRWFIKSYIPLAKRGYRYWKDLKLKATFEDVYLKNTWGDPESTSGPGSSLARTEAIRRELPKLIQEWRVASMLDIPCGDFFWMRHVDLETVRYIGADIVSDLIRSNQRQFGSKNREFRILDITANQLPRVDLIFCRDCLGHLSYRHIKNALSHIQRSGSRYLLTTTFPGNANVDNATGGWRPINLNAAPFCFPPPLRLINEQEPEKRYSNKSLALWAIDEIPVPRTTITGWKLF